MLADGQDSRVVRLDVLGSHWKSHMPTIAQISIYLNKSEMIWTELGQSCRIRDIDHQISKGITVNKKCKMFLGEVIR